MADEPRDAIPETLRKIRDEHRTGMRELTHRMIGLVSAMEGMREQIRDIQGRLTDVIDRQVTTGDLGAIHFELNRFAERLDALESAPPAE
jgi:hypothetical protein